MTRPRHLIAAAILCTALVATTAAACTPDDPTPSPTTSSTSTPTTTPTPTPTPTLSEKDQNIADAKAAYELYVATRNVVEQGGMTNWREQILPLVGGDLRAQKVSFYEQAVEQQLRQTGATTIAALTATGYTPSTVGNDQVTLEVCNDNSGVDLVDPSGKSVLQPGFPPRLTSIVVMQHQGGERWTVNSASADVDRPC